MWLATRTRPDISSCLGILASLMVRRPLQVKAHLIDLWRYLWTTSHYAMCTLPRMKKDESDVHNVEGKKSSECDSDGNKKRANKVPPGLHTSDTLSIQTYCDASFAPGGGRSRSGILVLLVDEISNRSSVVLWVSRTQTLTALSAPEAEVVAISEALMPSVIMYESCLDFGVQASE